MKPKYIIFVLTGVSCVLLVVSLAGRSFLVIHFGIRFYGTIKVVSALSSAIGICACIILLLKGKVWKYRKVVSQPIISEENVLLQEKLLEYRDKEWFSIRESIDNAVDYLRQMNDIQARLDLLLEQNNAAVLSDTKDAMQQVEDYLCRNIRSAVNYMVIYRNDRRTDVIKMQAIIDQCNAKNREKLDEATDFMEVLTRFLNDRDDSGVTTDTLDVYKKTLVDFIQEDKL